MDTRLSTPTNSIDMSEYKAQIETFELDMQYRFNHKDCPSGHDTRKRLYIKKMDNGAVLAYCHNCGNKGVLSPKGRQYTAHKSIEKTVNDAAASGFILPSDRTCVLSEDCNSYARAFLYKYDFYDHDISCIEYSPSLNRLMYPIVSVDKTDHKEVGKVLRRLGLGTSPRYLVYNESENINGLLSNSREMYSKCVIVEDYLSALKIVTNTVGKYVDVFYLNGTHLTSETLVQIRKYANIAIHLDDDPSGISASSFLFSEIHPVIATNTNLHVNTGAFPEPKLMSRKQIKQIYG